VTGESHRSLRERLGAYALGQLSGDRWRAVHDHLEVCALCRADLDEIAPVAGLLGVTRDRLRPDDLTGDDAPAPPPLSESLLEQVRAASAATDLDGRRPRHRRTALLAAAAAAGVLLAGGVGFVVGGSGGPSVPREVVAVRALAPGISAQASLINHTWGMEVVLTATGFEPGEAYAVSVTDDAGRTVGAGEFLGTGDAQMRCNLNSSVLRVDAALVQVTAPDGEVVLDATV
jgi:anti-sigma factor RsiW